MNGETPPATRAATRLAARPAARPTQNCRPNCRPATTPKPQVNQHIGGHREKTGKPPKHGGFPIGDAHA